MYPTLGASSLTFITKQLDLKYLFCGTPYDKGIEIINSKPGMGLVTFDDAKDIPSDINHFNYSDLLNYGRSHPVEPDLPQPDDTFSIIFTSGTSGNPKGVIHTHKSMNNAVPSPCQAPCLLKIYHYIYLLNE